MVGGFYAWVVYRREHGEKAARSTSLGQAVSHRFKRDSKGWRVFATTELPEVEVTTDRGLGVIGIDPQRRRTWPWPRPMPAATASTPGGRRWSPTESPLNRPRTLIGDVMATVVQHAKESEQAYRHMRSWTSGGRRLSW